MRLHLVDGTYELFRAHFSKRPDHATPDGHKGKATLGLVSSLLALVADPRERVTHLAVAFDNPIRSFRNQLFAGYKTEAGVDPGAPRRSSTAPRRRCARSASPSGRWIAGRRTTRWRRRRRASVDRGRPGAPADAGQGSRPVHRRPARGAGRSHAAKGVRRGGAGGAARRPAGEHPRLARAHRRRRRRRARAARLRRQERGGGAGQVRAPRGDPRRSQGVAADGARRRAAGAHARRRARAGGPVSHR